MSDTIRDLLVRGIAAAKAGDAEEAQRYLDWLMRLDPSMEEKKEAWFWMSEAATSQAEKRKYLEEILAHDPWDSRARRALAVVDGKLNPDEIINPDQSPPKPADGPQPTKADRFVCPKCGGRMVFTPNGQALECEYCLSRERAVTGRLRSKGSEEADFIIGLATARGHLKPASMQAVSCQGCGAEFIVPPAQITHSCPYCRSAHVLSQSGSRLIAPPNGLIPFTIAEDYANQSMREWFTRQSFATTPVVAPLQGIYLPIWCFDMGGTITVRFQVQMGKNWVDRTEQRTVQQRDLLVLASKRLPEPLRTALQGYDLTRLLPYNERYLVNWPAETYQISMADASLLARTQAFERQKEHLQGALGGEYTNITFSSAGMVVETYQLILLPVWLANYQLAGQTCPILVNGQTAEVVAQRPETGRKSWVERLLNNE